MGKKRLKIIADEQIIPPIKFRLIQTENDASGAHKRRGADTVPSHSADRLDGNPPVRVKISEGRIVDVPHYATYVSRKYRRYVNGELWKFRFHPTGELKSARKV